MAARLVLAACLLVSVSAHSWLDCANWKFKDPTAYANPAVRRWADADGTCEGHARKYEVGVKPFGKFDEVQFFRHYVQPFGGSSIACRVNDGSFSASGSSEGVQNPRSRAYGPNANVYGQVYGKMSSVYSGDLMCWRWPAKNHYAHVDIATNKLQINWDTVPGRTSDITQTLMDSFSIGTILWANCPVPGVTSSGDTSGVGSELRPCGGCFTVPARSAGIYTVQWKWIFHDGEIYTSCADIEVKSSAGVTPVNCVVSAWSGYGSCSSNCGSGTQSRTRTITTAQVSTGTACPALTQSQSCNTGACTNSISEHVVYDDVIVGFQDWSWSTSYSLSSTVVVRSGKSISFTPKAWEAVYLHHSAEALPVSVADFQSISFYVNGGSGSGQSIVFALTNSRTNANMFNYQIPTTKFARNTWNLVEIKFADLGYTSGSFDGIFWQANGAGSQSTIYIDDVYFMHVHEGGAAPVATDRCTGVTCPANSACVAGTCSCINGYSGATCTTAPRVSGVTVKSLAGLTVTTLSGGESIIISWTTTGTIPTLTLTLERSGAVPVVIVSSVVNSGSYTWQMVPNDLVAGTYTVKVAYTSAIAASSGSLVKSAAAVPLACASDCNGHGVCDEDTFGKCVCRYGYTGTTCTTAPSGLIRLAGSIKVATAYSLWSQDTKAAAIVFRTDLSKALGMVTDQIEVKTAKQEGTGTRVTFDVLVGGGFAPATVALLTSEELTATLDQQTADADSNLNQGIDTYSAVSNATSLVDSSSTGGNTGGDGGDGGVSAAPRAAGMSLFVVLAALVAAIAAAL